LQVPEKTSPAIALRHLPGTPEFCRCFSDGPVAQFIEQDWKERRARRRQPGSEGPLARTAAFLLLKDSKSSYVIEGEQPPQTVFSGGDEPSARQGMQLLMKRIASPQKIVIGDERL